MGDSPKNKTNPIAFILDIHVIIILKGSRPMLGKKRVKTTLTKTRLLLLQELFVEF